ncbi:MAG: prepilin-type N-terminal cleavage/methylation domain-containing protein [Phycisphaerae bacterium]|nr:prepilin-type N-terminal cleavage/methylation domain-containing protein [Phycisphaerae bacterium]
MARLGRSTADRRHGFTLIEVLVVVAIIALLISILLPSLTRARGQSQFVVCQTHLKEFGKAISMYSMEYKDTLPGPQHPALLTHTPAWTNNQFVQDHYLPNLLRKYFAQRGTSTNSIADQLATCPSYPVPDGVFKQNNITPTHYVINTFGNSNPDIDELANPFNSYFFGFTHGGILNQANWESTYGTTPQKAALYRPKRVSTIRKPYRKYALADAFCKPFANDPGGELRAGLPEGSWRISDDYAANTGKSLSKSPFHLGSGYKKGSSTEYQGKTAVVFLDNHAEGVNPEYWRKYENLLLSEK